MSSLFDESFAEVGRPLLMEQLGETVTYTPPGGSPQQLTAIVEAKQTEEIPATEGRNYRRVREVIFSKADLANPALKATVTIDSEIWSVQDIPSDSPALVSLRVVHIGRIEESRPEYRRR